VTATQEADSWKKDYDDFVHGRMARVQTAAQQWLVTMTALLGLFSTAIIVGGANTIDKVSLPQPLVIALAAVVYLLALAAEIYGALATFGGLGLHPVSEDERRYAEIARELQHDCRDPKEQLKTAKKLRAKQHRLKTEWIHDNWSPLALVGGPNAYKDRYELRTNKLREYLHRSRVLGALAALAPGLLSFLVLCSS
jgi:hypothetical protein